MAKDGPGKGQKRTGQKSARGHGGSPGKKSSADGKERVPAQGSAAAPAPSGKRPADNKGRSRAAISGSPGLFLLAFWGLAVLLFYPPYFRGLFFAGEQAWTLILAVVLFVVALAWQFSKEDLSFLSHPADWLLLGLTLLYGLAFFWAASPRMALAGAVKYVLYFLVFWMVSRLAASRRRMHILLNVLYLSAVGVALAGFLTAAGVIHIKDGFMGGRIYSTMQYPNTLAIYLAALSLPGFYLWAQARGWRRFAYALGNYVLILIYITAGSRGGYLVYPLGLILLFLGGRARWRDLAGHFIMTVLAALIGNTQMLPGLVAGRMAAAWGWLGLGAVVALLGQVLLAWLEVIMLKYKSSRKYLTAGIAGLTLLFLLAAGTMFLTAGSKDSLAQKVLPAQVLSRIRDMNLESMYSQERLDWAGDAIRMVRLHPVLGLGGGAWEATYRGFQGYHYNSTQVHNDWLQLTLEVGGLGLALAAGVWIAILFISWQNLRRGDEADKLRQAAVTAAMVSIGAHAFIDFDLSLSSVAIVLWALWGLTRAQQQVLAGAGPPKRGGQPAAARWYFFTGAAAVSLGIIIITGMLLAGARAATAGIQAYQQKNLARATSQMEKAVASDRWSTDYRINLGQFYAVQGKVDEGLQLIDEAMAREPYNWRIPAVKAEVLLNGNKKDPVQGLALLMKARDLAPWMIERWDSIAWFYAISGLNSFVGGSPALDQARENFRLAAAVPEEMSRRVEALGQAEQKLWSQRNSFPLSPRVQLSAGIGNYFLGRFSAANNNLTIASKSKTTQGDGLLWLSLLREKEGKKDEAQKLYQEATGAGSAMAKDYENLKKLPVLKE